MADGRGSQADVPTNTNPSSTARVAVNPLSQVAVAILYGERVRYPEEQTDRRHQDWKWENTASAEALDAREDDSERNPFKTDANGNPIYAPAGEWSAPVPDPQFAAAADRLAKQLEDAGVLEVKRLPLRQAGSLATTLPLAAVLVASHGGGHGAIPKYTYLAWKYYTQLKPWRQWRDRDVGAAWNIDEFLGKVVRIRKKGMLVVYGCSLGAPGSGTTRQEAADATGVSIVGWPGLVYWELPDQDKTLDRTPQEQWKRLSFKDEENKRLKLKEAKKNLRGSGLAGLSSGGAMHEVSDLVPYTTTEPRSPAGGEVLGKGNVMTLIRKAAIRVMQELAKENSQKRSK